MDMDIAGSTNVPIGMLPSVFSWTIIAADHRTETKIPTW
jgi:hypothetical protein